METVSLQKVKMSTIVYWVISIWIFAYILLSSMLNIYAIAYEITGKIILASRIALVLLAAIMCFKGIKKRKFFLLIGYVTLVVINYITADNWALFDMFFVCFFFGDYLQYSKVLKTYGRIMILGTIVVVALYILGAFPQYQYITSRVSHPRWWLGFHSPNTLAETIMSIVFVYFILNFNKRRIITCFMMVLAALFVWIFPDSLTVAIVIVLVLIIRLTINKFFEHANLIKKKRLFIITIILALCIVSFVYFVLLDSRFDAIIYTPMYNTVFGRIKLGRIGLEKYGITLFGTAYQNVIDTAIYTGTASESDYFVLDCLYYLLPIRYGIVFTVIYFIAYFRLLYKTIIDNNIELFSIMFAMIIMGITSSFITIFIMSFIFVCAKCYKPVHGRIFQCDAAAGLNTTQNFQKGKFNE